MPQLNKILTEIGTKLLWPPTTTFPFSLPLSVFTRPAVEFAISKIATLSPLYTYDDDGPMENSIARMNL